MDLMAVWLVMADWFDLVVAGLNYHKVFRDSSSIIWFNWDLCYYKMVRIFFIFLSD